jgi:hypothetical protein
MRLIGTSSNRDAIGARVKVEIETPNGTRAVHALVGTGGSFGSSSLQQEIGLADATRIKSVEVRWPGTDSIQRFEEVPLDKVIEIREGEPTFSLLTPPRLSLRENTKED